MSQLTLLDIVTYVQDYLPDRPQAKIARAANLVLKRIHTRIGVPQRTTVTTKAKSTAFTADVVSGTADVTFSGAALSTTDPFTVVQISGVQEWFNVTRVTNSTGTLSSVWPGATTTGLSCTIAYPLVSFPSTVMIVKRMWQEGYKELVFAGDEKQEAPLGWFSAPGISSGRLSPGRPIWWSPYAPDLSASPDDTLRRMLAPWPDQAYVFSVSYLQRATLFDPVGATSQKSALSMQFDQAILDGTLYHSFVQDDKRQNAELWKLEYQGSLNEALSDLGVVSRLGDGGQETGIWVEEGWPVGGS